ncbi:MAG: hypothetical protein OXG55_08255 [bacterium]|nr:hypothetical protein [bacterium]
MARQTEGSINHDLAAALRELHPAWNEQTVLAESTDVLTEGVGRKPDIVITNVAHLGGVILETEIEPARTVEEDALARLGDTFLADGSPVEQAVAVRIPVAARAPGTPLDTLRYAYRVCTNGTQTLSWFPDNGWIEGSIADLAGFVETVAVSPRQLAQGVNTLESGVRQASTIIRRGMEDTYQAGLDEMAAIVHQRDGEQTTRMAAAIIANALTVHSAIAAVNPEIRSLTDPSMRGYGNILLQSEVSACWQAILEVNYWPIFDVARRVLVALDEAIAGQALSRLSDTASRLRGLGATTIGDMAGQMFGQLIADRKFLATFYTRPSSATLLAELAVARLSTNWHDPEAVGDLRIADLACGTGALLSAVYRRIVSRVRRGGLDDRNLHAGFMERGMVGCDIMPAATHLTAAQLTAAHPTVTFGNTRIHTMPYGEHDPGGGTRIFIGSLELLDDTAAPSLLGTGATTVTGTGEIADSGDHQLDLPNGSIDLVIMNPPFTRPTNHEIADVPVPSFAGFETSTLEQREMSKRLGRLRRKLDHEPAGHGNAGLASNFLDLAHSKVKAGGEIALVLPSTVSSGDAWAPSRRLLGKYYRDTIIVTISGASSGSSAFSADTDMAEALIVATRLAANEAVEAPAPAVLWVNLARRPDSIPEAVEIARAIRNIDRMRPTGRLRVGNDIVGCFARASVDDGGCAQVAETDVIETALALGRQQLQLAGLAQLPIPVTTLSQLGTPGPYHLDIRSGGTTARGPFEIEKLPPSTTPSYPALWRHHAARERGLVVAPDSQGRILPGRRDKALELWETSTRLHLSSDFRLNSQSLGACLTRRRTIGGRAWPSYLLDDCSHEKAAVLWFATTLGLIAHWWVGSRQQQGRSILSIGRLGELRVIDCRDLSSKQFDALDAAFDQFANSDLLPANEAYRDPVRAALDKAVLCEALGLPEEILAPLSTLREQWCAEPTVHGGKATAPSAHD